MPSQLNISLPEKFSRRVTSAIESGHMFGDDRSAFVRECVDFFEPILPQPSKDQFNDLSWKLCDEYSSLRDAKKNVYWVRKYEYRMYTIKKACMGDTIVPDYTFKSL